MALATSCSDTDTGTSLRHCHVSRQHHGRFWVSLFIEAHKRLKLENEEYLLRCDATDRADKKADFGSDRLGTLGRAEDCLHTTDCPRLYDQGTFHNVGKCQTVLASKCLRAEK